METKKSLPIPVEIQHLDVENLDLNSWPPENLDNFEELGFELKEILFDYYFALRDLKERMLKEEEKEFIIENGALLKAAKTELEFLALVEKLKANSTNLKCTLMFRRGDGVFEISFGENKYSIVIGVKPRRVEEFSQPLEYIFICSKQDT